MMGNDSAVQGKKNIQYRRDRSDNKRFSLQSRRR